MKRSCKSCYHYNDHDGYEDDNCGEPNYDPVDMLHNNGSDALPNKPFPKAYLCSEWKSSKKIYRRRYSSSILNNVLTDIGENYINVK